MKKSSRIVIAAAIVAASVVPVSAFAHDRGKTGGEGANAWQTGWNAGFWDDNKGDNSLQQVGLAAIDRRLKTLERLGKYVDAAKSLTGSHRDTLSGQIDDTVAGLKSLRATIAVETDQTKLEADVHSIITLFRVYSLVVPRTKLTLAADRVQGVVAKFRAIEPKIQTAIDAAAAAGKDTTEANALFADLKAKVADAGTESAGVAGQVLPLKPAGYPGFLDVLRSARDHLRAAHKDLGAAFFDAIKIKHALFSDGEAEGEKL